MTEPGGPVRVGLVGFGLGGAVFHAPLIEAIEGMVLASIVTSNPDRAAQAGARYPDARVLPHVDAFWDAAREHDLVVVVTPNRFHVPIGLAALDLGLHLVVDKPLAPSAAEGRRLASAAADRGLVFSVFQNRRLDGDFLTVRRLIDDGTMGEVVRFESRFERWRPEVDAIAWRERVAAEEAGGLLFDLGSHLVDQAVQLFGRPTHVYAEVERRRAGAEVDDDTFVALRHPNGAVSHLWASAVAASLGPRLRVLGLAAAYEKSGLDPQEEQLAAGMAPSDVEYGREPEERWGRLSVGGEVRAVPTERGRYPRYYEGVAAAIRDGAPPPVSGADAIATLEILEAARASGSTGTVVEVP
ncbi:MAG: Gfo/Idh/MocA family protein [Actinomycetota bacterium]